MDSNSDINLQQCPLLPTTSTKSGESMEMTKTSKQIISVCLQIVVVDTITMHIEVLEHELSDLT